MYCRSRRIESRTSQRDHSIRATPTSLEALSFPSGADLSKSSPAFVPSWHHDTQGQKETALTTEHFSRMDDALLRLRTPSSLHLRAFWNGHHKLHRRGTDLHTEIVTSFKTAGTLTCHSLSRCHAFKYWNIEHNKLRQCWCLVSCAGNLGFILQRLPCSPTQYRRNHTCRKRHAPVSRSKLGRIVGLVSPWATHAQTNWMIRRHTGTPLRMPLSGIVAAMFVVLTAWGTLTAMCLLSLVVSSDVSWMSCINFQIIHCSTALKLLSESGAPSERFDRRYLLSRTHDNRAILTVNPYQCETPLSTLLKDSLDAAVNLSRRWVPQWHLCCYTYASPPVCADWARKYRTLHSCLRRSRWCSESRPPTVTPPSSVFVNRSSPKVPHTFAFGTVGSLLSLGNMPWKNSFAGAAFNVWSHAICSDGFPPAACCPDSSWDARRVFQMSPPNRRHCHEKSARGPRDQPSGRTQRSQPSPLQLSLYALPSCTKRSIPVASKFCGDPNCALAIGMLDSSHHWHHRAMCSLS